MQYEPKINGYEVVGMLFIMGTNSFYCYFLKKTYFESFLKRSKLEISEEIS